MNTNYSTVRTAGMVVVMLAAIAQFEATPSTLTRENHYAKGREDRGNSDGSTFLPLNSAPAGRTNHAVPALDRDDRYAAIGSRTNGLVGWWKLDETEGTLASDSSGNGHNATLLNGPTWTTGQLRGALSFDGTNDQVTCADSAALRISGDLTIAFWMKKNAEANKASFVVGKGNIKV